MKTSHLTEWEQEEYLINQRSPQLLRHLSECQECSDKVARMEKSLSVFRSAAVEYSAQTLAERPASPIAGHRSAFGYRWAFAALVPLLLLALLLFPLFPLHRTIQHPAQATPQLSDDALLDQVDEQLSVTVPSSMESLTHLVSAQDARSARGSKSIAETN